MLTISGYNSPINTKSHSRIVFIHNSDEFSSASPETQRSTAKIWLRRRGVVMVLRFSIVAAAD